MADTELIIIVAAAFAGTLGAGIYGWLKTGNPFRIAEFYGTIRAAFLSAGLFVLGYADTNSQLGDTRYGCEGREET